MIHLFLENIAYSALFIGVVLFAGFLTLRLFNVGINKKYYDVFVIFLIGFFLIVAIFAIGVAKGKTILLGFVIISCFLRYDKYKSNIPDSYEAQIEDGGFILFLLKRWLEVVVVLAVIIFYKLYFFVPGGYLIDPVYNDYVFYAKLSNYLLETGHENSYLDYIFNTSSFSPYHYVDIWINSLLIWITGENAVILMILSSYTIGLAGVWLGLVTIVETFLPITFFSKVLALLLIFFSGIYLGNVWDIPFIKSTGVFVRHSFNYSKLFPIYFVVILLVLYYRFKKWRLLESLLFTLPVINISTAPGVFLLAAGLLVIHWKQDRQLTKQLSVKILTMGIFLIFFYTVGQGTASGEDWKSSWRGYLNSDFLRTCVNIIAGAAIQFVIIYSPVIIAIMYIDPKGIRDLFGKLIVVIVCYFSFIIPWTLFHRSPNSVQLFSNFFVPFSSCLAILILLEYLSQDFLKVSKKIVAFIALLGLPLFALGTDFMERDDLSRNTSMKVLPNKSFLHFFDSIKNSVGVYFNNTYDWASKSTVFGTPDVRIQQFVNRPKLHTISLSVFEIPLDTNSINYSYEKSIVENSIFAQYIKIQDSQKGPFNSKDINQVLFYQLKFIKDYKIEYVLSNYGYDLPKPIKDVVHEEFADSTANLRVYVVKKP